MKEKMWEVMLGPSNETHISVRYHIMALTAEAAIQEVIIEQNGDSLDAPNKKRSAARQVYADRLVAQESVMHPKTGRWVPVDWCENRIAEIKGQIKDLESEREELEKIHDKAQNLAETVRNSEIPS